MIFNNKQNHQHGFTLIEILVVMVILGSLMTITITNIIQPQQTATISSYTDTLINDLNSQQLLSMSGSRGTASIAQAHGIYFEANQYTLFTGASYSASSPDNLIIRTDGVTIGTNLASSQVLFRQLSGEPDNYNPAANSITLTNVSGQNSVITINRYGVLSLN